MNANEIIIPCRLSYANIWEPKQVNGTGDPKYSCCLLIQSGNLTGMCFQICHAALCSVCRP